VYVSILEFSVSTASTTACRHCCVGN